MRNFLVAFFILLFFAVAQAEEQLILTATNDQDAKVDTLYLRLDSKGQATHLVHRASGVKERVYTSSTIEKGVVLKRKSDRDLIVLSTKDFKPKAGGAFVLRYLYTGLPPQEYRSEVFQIENKNGSWAVYQGKVDKPISAILFRANTVTAFGLTKAVGIKDIQIKR